jgi:hypothetical protein
MCVAIDQRRDSLAVNKSLDSEPKSCEKSGVCGGHIYVSIYIYQSIFLSIHMCMLTDIWPCDPQVFTVAHPSDIIIPSFEIDRIQHPMVLAKSSSLPRTEITTTTTTTKKLRHTNGCSFWALSHP